MTSCNKMQIKSQHYEKLNYLFSRYNRILLVDLTNISSKQIQKCRKMLGKNSVLIVEKNTMIRKILKYHIQNKQDLENFSSFVDGNVGLIFSKIESFEVNKILELNEMNSPAKPGQVSRHDVMIPAGLTNVPPEGTALFQSLNIQTKIQKGQIEILSPVSILKKGQIVGVSESMLLQKLNILPFSYKLEIKQVFDRDICVCYGTSVLSIKADDIEVKFRGIIQKINLISIFLNYPSHIYLNNFIKKLTIRCFLIEKII